VFHPAHAALALVGALANIPLANAQEMEPRAFSVSPIGTNFLVGGYTRSTGGVSTDPSLPITNVEAVISSGILGYQRTFSLAGRTASAALLVPYVNGDVSGDVEEQSRRVSRTGLGDVRLRFTANLVGGPALTPAQFTQRTPTATLGASLTVVAPTGQYNPAHLINISSHRWAFKPEMHRQARPASQRAVRRDPLGPDRRRRVREAGLGELADHTIWWKFPNGRTDTSVSLARPLNRALLGFGSTPDGFGT